MCESNLTSKFFNHDISNCNYLWAFFSHVNCLFKLWGYVCPQSNFNNFIFENKDKKGRCENIMFYTTFYCVKKYMLMNWTKLLFKKIYN